MGKVETDPQVATPAEVIGFWIDEVGPEGWYGGGEALDAQIRDRFGKTYEALAAGKLEHWLTGAEGALAYLLVTDQFTRNMFRGQGQAFATDAKARAAAKTAIDRDWDLKTEGSARQFFYMPLVHSECLPDQDRAVRLFRERMPEATSNLLHAKAHRAVIRRFGRFPFRNEALGRETTEAEAAWLEDTGYMGEVKALQSD